MPASKGSIPWNAGTSKGWVDQRGYRWIYVLENGKRRARREHRVLVERHIGRRLEPWEVVHHKDGNTQNNALENLEVIEFGKHTADHHRGTRKSRESKKSMEAFGLMREELRAMRSVNAELLEALADLMRNFPTDDDLKEAGWDDLEIEAACQAYDRALAAYTKAEGRS